MLLSDSNCVIYFTSRLRAALEATQCDATLNMLRYEFFNSRFQVEMNNIYPILGRAICSNPSFMVPPLLNFLHENITTVFKFFGQPLPMSVLDIKDHLDPANDDPTRVNQDGYNYSWWTYPKHNMITEEDLEHAFQRFVESMPAQTQMELPASSIPSGCSNQQCRLMIHTMARTIDDIHNLVLASRMAHRETSDALTAEIKGIKVLNDVYNATGVAPQASEVSEIFRSKLTEQLRGGGCKSSVKAGSDSNASQTDSPTSETGLANSDDEY
ncbi:hypothetical protein CPB83DRAFT_911777 [Crepidotus variabilis]|uniref:Uncharacterized protein n=1 Tax=Crepidotus variabilis TaxID=179855 RepID=A0A9P6BBF3_9AGAR|nr:hypothetical protein CPB83DRAFT_911777 [Crepidotus variabilis]